MGLREGSRDKIETARKQKKRTRKDGASMEEKHQERKESERMKL